MLSLAYGYRFTIMGKRHAKVVSRDAFIQAFAEAEYVMRKNLSSRIEVEAEKETNEDRKAGLLAASKIVYGEVQDESGTDLG